MGFAQEIIELLEEQRPIIIEYKDGDTIVFCSNTILSQKALDNAHKILGKLKKQILLVDGSCPIDKVIHISDANEKEEDQGIPLVGGKKHYTQENIQEAIDSREGGI